MLCAIDAAPIALTVTEQPNYCFCCTACGETSAWFGPEKDAGLPWARAHEREAVKGHPAAPWVLAGLAVASVAAVGFKAWKRRQR